MRRIGQGVMKMENEQVKVRVHDALALKWEINTIENSIENLASDWRNSYTGQRMNPVDWIIKKAEVTAELNLLHELKLISQSQYKHFGDLLNRYKLAYEGSVY